MYWIGLVISSIAIGHRYEQVDGWMVLGAGMMLFVILRATFQRIHRCK
jgi:hypothetical protein